MLPNPFPRHGLAMARERTSARFSHRQRRAADEFPAAGFQNAEIPDLAVQVRQRTRQQQALRRTFHEQTVDLLRIAHPRGAQDWLHDTTLLSKKRFNKKERPSSRNKLRRMAPSTGLSRSGSIFKAVVPLHTGAMPAETPSNKGLTSLSIETIRDDIPVFIASHNSWHRQSPFFLRDGATTRLGATPGCGLCHVLYCGKDRFRNATATMRPATASGPSVSTPPRRAASGHVPAAGH